MEELTMEQRKEGFALRLFDIGAVQFGEFELRGHKDAPKSSFDLDLRRLKETDNYDATDLMFRRAVRECGLVNYTCIAGIPNAGDPFAGAFQDIACQAEHPLFFKLLKLGKEVLPDGTRRIGKLLEGEYVDGDAVMLVDDRIARGDSKLEAMQTLMERGFDITGLVVLVDCEQGGSEKIVDAGFQFVAVYTLTELLRIYKSAGKISEDQLWSCLVYQDELEAYFSSKG